MQSNNIGFSISRFYFFPFSMIIYAMHCSLMLVSLSHLLLISIQNMYVQGKLKHVVEENLLNILFTGINLLNVILMDCSYAILGIASKTVIFCAF